MNSNIKWDETEEIKGVYSNNQNEKGERVNLKLVSYRMINYKVFHDSGFIDLCPLVFFYGPNSAGKSAIHSPLLLLKQAYINDLSQLYTNTLMELDVSKPDFFDLINRKYADEEMQLVFRFLDEEKKICDYTVGFRYKDDAVIEEGFIEYRNNEYRLSDHFRFRNSFFTVKVTNDVPDPVSCIVEGVMNALRGFAESFNYIAPSRVVPERRYFFPAIKRDAAFNGVDHIYENLFAGMKDGEITNQWAVDWIREFGYELKWKSLGPNRGEFLLVNIKSGVETNLIDNGYGIGQSLPIIMALSYMDQNTLLVDSPEAFLQTDKHGVLADYFIKNISRDSAIIVETGSEYMLYRIRRRIAEKKCDRNDIRLYYVDSESEDGAACIKIDILDGGELSRISDGFNGFFSSSFEDLGMIMNGGV